MRDRYVNSLISGFPIGVGNDKVKKGKRRLRNHLRK